MVHTFTPDTTNPLLKRSPKISLADYIAAQKAEIDSSLNEWGAGEEFDTASDRNKCWEHYIHCGRAFEMCEIHSEPVVTVAQLQFNNGDLFKSTREEREAALQSTFDLVMWRIGLRLGQNPRELPLERREQEIITTCKTLIEEFS